MSALDEVIGRLEKGESGIDIDAAVWAAIHGYGFMKVCDTAAYTGRAGVGVLVSVPFGTSNAESGPLPYTTSLDAAVSLVPEGEEWSATGNIGPEYGKPAHAYVSMESPDKMGATMYQAKAPTPALALCIAALKARQAKARADAGSER